MKKLGSVPCVAVRSLTHYSEYVILISDPKCPPIFSKARDPVARHVIHQTKPKTSLVHHTNGYQDPSTYVQEKGWLDTNHDTPCNKYVA